MISEFKRYHGSAIAELLDDAEEPISISRYDLNNNAVYILNSKIALFIKHSTKRIAPWRFSFAPEHLLVYFELQEKYQHIFVVLVCGNDSVAVINANQFSKLIDVHSLENSWISVTTSHNTSMQVEGSFGALKTKLLKSKPFHELKNIL
jgi:hypothetical protein